MTKRSFQKNLTKPVVYPVGLVNIMEDISESDQVPRPSVIARQFQTFFSHIYSPVLILGLTKKHRITLSLSSICLKNGVCNFPELIFVPCIIKL